MNYFPRKNKISFDAWGEEKAESKRAAGKRSEETKSHQETDLSKLIKQFAMICKKKRLFTKEMSDSSFERHEKTR